MSICTVAGVQVDHSYRPTIRSTPGEGKGGQTQPTFTILWQDSSVVECFRRALHLHLAHISIMLLWGREIHSKKANVSKKRNTRKWTLRSEMCGKKKQIICEKEQTLKNRCWSEGMNTYKRGSGKCELLNCFETRAYKSKRIVADNRTDEYDNRTAASKVPRTAYRIDKRAKFV